MKILFVDNSAELQQKWIEPLRSEGWGALRARSPEDADRMLILHGDSIEAVVIHESMVSWAEKHDFPFVVLTQKWGEADVLRHQNSARSAFYYQPLEGQPQALRAAIQDFKTGGSTRAQPASQQSDFDRPEKTQWAATRKIALEDFSGVLTKPEVTKTGTQGSIKLEAPTVFFGGEKPAVSSSPQPPPISNEDLTSVRIRPEPTESSFKLETVSDPREPQTEMRSAEVMEVKLDPLAPGIPPLDLPSEGATRVVSVQSVPVVPPVESISDSTAALESSEIRTRVDATSSSGLTQAEFEVEHVEELSMNEQVQYSSGRAQLGEAIGSGMASGGLSPSRMAPPAQVQSGNYGTPVTPPPVVRVIEGDDALKSYLALREQDVAVLTGQVRSSQERIQQLEMQLKVEKARSIELQHVVQKQEQTLHQFENEKQVELEVLYRQVEDLNAQLQERTNKAHTIEAKLRLAQQEVNKVKERVRVDIRRIRVREKELENQLEILKKDSVALLQARDEKIVDLKRRLDLLEFNMELVQEQYSKERQHTEDLRNRLKDAAKAMRQAGGLLEQ